MRRTGYPVRRTLFAAAYAAAFLFKGGILPAKSLTVRLVGYIIDISVSFRTHYAGFVRKVYDRNIKIE